MFDFGRSFFENDFFRDRGPRGRSRRENSGKILAAAFSRRDFLMVLGEGPGGPDAKIGLIILPARPHVTK